MGGENEQLKKTKKIPLFKTEEKEATKSIPSNPITSVGPMQEQKKKIPLFPEQKSLNEAIGDTIIQYDKKLKEDQDESGLEVTIERFTMKQILDDMQKDSEKKHKEFRDMEEAFTIVANYSEYLKNCKKNGYEIRNYRDAIRMAELTAKKYQVDHKSLFHLTHHGKQRYRLSCRIVDIMDMLKSETAKAHEAFITKVDNKVENARVEEIINEKNLSEEDKGKLIEKWFTDGDKYKDLIKKIIGNDNLQDVDKETLERILVDKNNILIANKVTIGMICEENPDLTLGLSKMKDRLMDYVNKKLEADENSQKCLFSDVEEFRKSLREILDSYYSENSKLIDDIKSKKDRMIDELDIDAYDERYWTRDDINAFLMNTNEAEFTERLDILKTRMNDNFEIIEKLVDDKEFSSLCSMSIKKKIKSRLGDLMLHGGEMDVAEKVRDCLSYLTFLAPEEFSAETKISDLMKLYQIPRTEKDVFAKYLSGNTGIMGIAESSYAKLQYRALTFMQNLGGFDKKQKIFGINKLMLKVETWEKIEKLKCGMGEFSDEEFRKRIDELIEANNSHIDLAKPNVKYSDYSANRQEIRKNRNIGFSKRILGELFLESEEIKGLLDEKEVEYFQKNLIKKICPDESGISEMEFLPTSEIKKIANLLKNNLAGCKDQIKALHKQKGDVKEYLPEILMEITVRKTPANAEEIKRISEKVVNKHLYDKKQQVEIKKMLATLKSDSENDGTLDKERYNHFREMFDFLKTHKSGRYSLFAEKLCTRQDFYENLMALDKKGLSKYLEDTVEKKIGTAIDGVNAADSQPALKQLYLDRRFDLIYDGKVKGEIILFKSELKREEERYFKERRSSAKKVDKNITKAIDAAIKEYVKKNKRYGKDVSKKTAAPAVYSCAQELILEMYNDKDKFDTLLSADTLKERILKGMDDYENNMFQVELYLTKLSNNDDSVFSGYNDKNSPDHVEALKNHARFMSNIRRNLIILRREELMEKLPELVENYEKTYRKDEEVSSKHSVNVKELEEAKKIFENVESEGKIREVRDNYLGLRTIRPKLSHIFVAKSVVTDGVKTMTSLSTSNWQRTRDFVDRKLSKYYNFDSFLVDLLAEKNVNEFFGDSLENHADWLYNVSDMLTTADENEDPISVDEHKMLVCNAFRNIEKFKDPDRPGQYFSHHEIIKGPWYKEFRANYKILKKVEELELMDGPLEQERIGISRDLRAILSTDLNEPGMSFAKKAENAYRYLDYVNNFMQQADRVLETDETYKNSDRNIRDRYLLWLRSKYYDDIFADLSSEENYQYKPEKWNEVFNLFAENKAFMKHAVMAGAPTSVSNKTYGKENKNYLALTGKDMLEETIKKDGSHGCYKKYKKLSLAEKELFALGLMLMEKGATGFDQGSSQVLCSKTLRDKEVAPRLKELQKYMAGKDYDFKIDYTLCFYNLVNYGEVFTKDRLYTFSSDAFEKALEFAKGVTAKMKEKDTSVTDADKKIMGDGYTSIYTAAQLGKKQIEDVDKLRKLDMSPEVVKKKLIDFAFEDESELLKTAVVRGDRIQVIKEMARRMSVLKKLSKLDDTDTLRLIAILQNRAALDKSTADSSKYIDENKRKELTNMFMEDDQESTFKKYIDNGSCLQALVTALSFKMNDSKTFKDRKIEKSDFDSGSLNRYTKVDWELLETAIKFLDDQRKARIARYAVRNASSYIKASGNQKAIDAYENEMKTLGKAEMAKDQFENFLTIQAEKDRVSKDNKNAKVFLAGYQNLNDKQKKLFIKVLGRRDLLDISKKNLFKNALNSAKERDFVNETGRFKLIDEYIDKSLRGNVGVSLTETSYTDAFKSLLSTQVDDTAEFGSLKNIQNVLAGEKYFLFTRDTAVDWKLFQRALQFVTKADYELEVREGNEELYRSAGKLSKYGKLDMDYSILRHNIHRTGNRFVRGGLKIGKKVLTEGTIGNIKPFDEEGMSLKDIKDNIKSFANKLMPSLGEKINAIDEMLEDDDVKTEKRVSELPEFLTKSLDEYDFKGMIKGKITEKFYTSTQSLTNEISELVIGSFSDGIKLDKIGALIREKLNEVPKAGSESRLDSIIGTFKMEGQYGDIRDEINIITSKYNKVKGTIDGLPDKIHDKIMDNIPMKELIESSICSKIKEVIEDRYAEATAYVMSHIDEKTGMLKDIALDNPFVKSVKEIYDKSVATAAEYMAKPQEYIDKIQESVKEKVVNATKTITVGALGEERYKSLTEKFDTLKEFGQGLYDKINYVIGKINSYKEIIDNFRDIAVSIKNKKLLSKADTRAHSNETYEQDQKTLRDAESVQNSRQKKLNKNIVEEHRDLQKMSKDTANTMENLNITKDAIKISIAIGEEIFGKVDAGVFTGVVKTAVNAGIDFAMYCIRCLKDKQMLKTYYTETNKGMNTVRSIKNAYTKMTGSEDVTTGELGDRTELDLVCAAKGFETEEELVTDTGTKMATSIAFCASKYNPVKETKVMASTVMVVLGLKDKIGQTDASTIGEIFNKMKAS